MTEHPRRSYDLLLENIEADLRSGAISLGDQLPGERTLAETYGISRASVREGIRILDAMGVLRSSSGSGPKSGAIIISEPSAGLSSALRLHMASSRLPVADIVQTRVLLETWAAATAAGLPPSDAKEAALGRPAALLQAMDTAWIQAAPQASYGNRQRWLAMCAALRAAGWPLLTGPARWRLGEITVAWDAVAPA